MNLEVVKKFLRKHPGPYKSEFRQNCGWYEFTDNNGDYIDSHEVAELLNTLDLPELIEEDAEFRKAQAEPIIPEAIEYDEEQGDRDANDELLSMGA